MANWTEKQRKFVAAKVAGKKNREAAIEAGYSGNNASVAASQLMAKPAIKAAIAKGKKATTSMGDEDDPMSGVDCSDPLTFLEAMVANPKLSMSMRSRAAEQLLPYKHARIGEKGKKEKRTDDAKGVVKGGKFTPQAPPRLHAVK